MEVENDNLKNEIDEIEKIWKKNKFDPNGSYLGNARDEKYPIQDQDDL